MNKPNTIEEAVQDLKHKIKLEIVEPILNKFLKPLTSKFFEHTRISMFLLIMAIIFVLSLIINQYYGLTQKK